jgi:hypothetical protein
MTRYIPPRYPWNAGFSPENLGNSVPVINAEMEARTPRVWPAQYAWTLMGLGAMPLFQIGVTQPVWNNSYSPYAPAMNNLMPGLSKLPYG